ncbi:MAG: L-threonylcarbamoyladenylate synthase [Bacteroidota bacterium]|jgi:L-threonylcarbamoyladenylate synthase
MITRDIQLAVDCLDKNDVVGMPTETVYGLAGNAFSEQAVRRIFEVKKRPSCNPLIVHINGTADLSAVAADIPEAAVILTRHFWPGPLTVVLKKKSCIPDLVTAGKATVAVRAPDHPVAQELLRRTSYPLAAPSANPFGTISPTTAEHVDRYFGGIIPCVLDGGSCRKGIESTIIGFGDDGRPVILRLGSITPEEIEAVIGNVTIRNKATATPDAPGMLSRHYSPKTPLVISDNPEITLEMFADKNVGLLTFSDRVPDRPGLVQKVLSENGDMNEAAAALYAALHELDQLSAEVIITSLLPETGLGRALNDKLLRAAEKEDSLTADPFQ